MIRSRTSRQNSPNRRAKRNSAMTLGHGLEQLEARRLLAVVTSAADSGPGTLRDALLGPDPTITFDVAAMGTDTIMVGAELPVNRDVVIDGDNGSGGRVTLDGGGTGRVLRVNDLDAGNAANVTLRNLVVTGGGSGGSDGAGIFSLEALTLENMLVDGNSTAGDGAGVAHGNTTATVGALVITDSVISGNSAGFSGAGLLVVNTPSVTISGSEFSTNQSGRAPQGRFIRGAGVAISNNDGALNPTVEITDTLITGNTVVGRANTSDALALGTGLSIRNYASLMAVNIDGSTFSNNTDLLEDPDPADSDDALGRGGGAYIQAESVTIENSTFTGNYSYSDGGGLMLADASNDSVATLRNLTITDNGGPPPGRTGRTGEGGGFWFISFTNDLEVTIEDSVISGNSSFGGGGGMFRQGARGTIRNTVFENNYSNNGGGLRVLDFGSSVNVTVEDSTIRNNTAVFEGAGIDLLDVMPDNSSFNLVRSTVSGNVGVGDVNYPSYTNGGGLALNGMALTIDNSTIANNMTYTSGGGLYLEFSTAAVEINQSTITGNTADSGQIFNGRGGGVYANYSGYGINVNGSVFAGNYEGTTPADFNNVQLELSANHSFFGSSYTLYLPEAFPVPDADGNLVGPVGGAPVDPALGSLQDNGGPTFTRLPQMGSPLIDAGSMSVMGGTDQRGADRVYNGVVDMGATEYGSMVVVPVNGDFDGNMLLQCADLDLLTAETAAGTNDAAFDLTMDGLVNNADIQAWLVLGGAAPENAAATGGNPFLVGDADCNGSVDGADFIAWNSAKFTTNTKWTMGNFQW